MVAASHQKQIFQISKTIKYALFSLADMNKILACTALLVLLAACMPQERAPEAPFVEGTPVEIIEKYYNSWSVRDYATMYSLVSDGWKVLEPTARTQRDFAEFLDGAFDITKGIKIVSAVEMSNSGNEAIVAISLETELMDGRIAVSEQTLTLRLKENGWKLIHPYGDFADLS